LRFLGLLPLLLNGSTLDQESDSGIPIASCLLRLQFALKVFLMAHTKRLGGNDIQLGGCQMRTLEHKNNLLDFCRETCMDRVRQSIDTSLHCYLASLYKSEGKTGLISLLFLRFPRAWILYTVDFPGIHGSGTECSLFNAVRRQIAPAL
jgi:hypothetical protein